MMGNNVENEFKFTLEGCQDCSSITKRLEQYLDEHGVPYSEKIRQSVDSFFDTEDFRIYEDDCVLRRKVSSNGKIKLTIKKPISNEFRMMSRQEIEVPSDGSIEEIRAFAAEYLPGMEVGEEPVLVSECERTSIKYEDGSCIKLSVDACSYLDGGSRKDFCEIELESIDDSTQRDFDAIGMCDFITDELGFVTVTESKYRRGIKWLRG